MIQIGLFNIELKIEFVSCRLSNRRCFVIFVCFQHVVQVGEVKLALVIILEFVGHCRLITIRVEVELQIHVVGRLC